MLLFRASIASLLLAAGLVVSIQIDSPETSTINIDPETDPLDALTQLQQHAYEALQRSEGVTKRESNRCSLSNTSVRRDWWVNAPHKRARTANLV